MDHCDLTLPEQILTLVLTDRDGSVIDETPFRYALGGALLAELHARKRIELQPGTSGSLVTPVSRLPTEDPALDDALSKLHRATRRTDPETWVGSFAEDDELYLRVARQLCRKDALDEHEGRVRLIFLRTVYVDLADDVREEFVGRIRSALAGSRPMDSRTATVIAFARAARIPRAVFDLDELRVTDERLDTVLDDCEFEEGQREVCETLVAATASAVPTRTSLAA